MTVEFGAEIKLKSGPALAQMKKFADSTTEASVVLKRLQAEVKATSQGLGNSNFTRYTESLRRASAATKSQIAALNDLKVPYSKLTGEQQKLVVSLDKLNQKYDESARKAAKLKIIKNELQELVGFGAKTQKEANAIYDREARAIEKTTVSHKEKQAQLRKNNALQKAEAKELDNIRMKYDANYAIKKKIGVVERELGTLRGKNLISQRQYNRLLRTQSKRIAEVTRHTIKLTSAQNAMAKAARLVSVYSRVFLGLYAVNRLANFYKDLEITSEKIQLLTDKLEFLTGDSGAYNRLFQMTQDVGIGMEAANKIITRFAVVTNRAFSIDTMSTWSDTLIRSARATGTSTQEMSGALIQITQAMSAGRLMGDEYRSVTENLPLLTVALRDIFGQSTMSLKEMSSQGLITNDIMVEAFGKLKTMLEGFPDSSQTTEAAIGRLSSAWDNFIGTVINTSSAKSTFNYFTGLLNELQIRLKIMAANRVRDASNALIDEKIAAQKTIELNQETIDVLNRANKDRSEFNPLRIIDEKAIVSLNKDILAAKNDIKDVNNEILMQDEKDNAKEALKLADEKIQAERELNRIFSERLKTQNLIDKIEKGKSIQSIKAKSDLQRQEVTSKLALYGEGKAGGMEPHIGQSMFEKIANNEEEAIRKVNRAKIEGLLRDEKLKAKFDIKDIQRSLSHNGKLLEIEDQYAKQKLTLKSAARAMELSLDASLPEKERMGIVAAEYKKLTDALDAKYIKDTADELKRVKDEIFGIGVESALASAKMKQGLANREKRSEFSPKSQEQTDAGFSVLVLEKTKVMVDYEKSINSVNAAIKKEGLSEERNRELMSASKDILQSEMKDKMDVLDRDYTEEFDPYLSAHIEMTEALTELWDNTATSIMASVGDAMAVAIVDQKSFSKALEATLKQVAKSIISNFIQIGLKYVLMSLMAAKTEKGIVAASVVSANTMAAAWASAAAAVNAATAGASAVAGGIALTEIAALAQVLFATPKPQAHSGLDRTEEGTMKLRRDEMVLDPGTSKKVRDNILNATDNQDGGNVRDVIFAPVVQSYDADDILRNKEVLFNGLRDDFVDWMEDEGLGFVRR